jgi:hypothetical protein
MTEIIHFPAQIYKIQTTVDGAIRLTLDMPETQIDSARLLMECKMRGGLLEIAAVPIDQVITEKQKGNNAIQTRSEWKSEGTTQERPGANIPA